MVLKDKNILLGVTGSIAAYKSAEILRELVGRGCNVRVVMTEAATRFIGPQTLSTLSGKPALVKMFHEDEVPEVEHVKVPEEADALLIAPATANIIAKMAVGIADDLLSTMLLVARCPVLVAPAMNSNMYTHPAVEVNIARLKERGVKIIEPGFGDLACGYTGPGRLAPVDDILEDLQAALTVQDLEGVNVLVTAGPTREPLDPVRFISNRSSGKMGYAIARAAIRHGARVTLISGPTGLAAPRKAALVNVETAGQMNEACKEHIKDCDVVIMTAAVADFRPKEEAPGKIKRGKDEVDLKLVPNPDIIRGLAADKTGDRLMVGFAAETDDVVKHASEKLKSKKLDMMVANRVNTPDSGFDHDTNRIRILLPDGTVEPHPLMTKDDVAETVISKIARLLKKKG